MQNSVICNHLVYITKELLSKCSDKYAYLTIMINNANNFNRIK